jgi:hypothetical protein
MTHVHRNELCLLAVALSRIPSVQIQQCVLLTTVRQLNARANVLRYIGIDARKYECSVFSGIVVSAHKRMPLEIASAIDRMQHADTNVKSQ